MNLNTTLIGFFFLFLFLSPIIYVLIKEKRGRHKIFKRIDALCKKHQLQKSKPEIIGNFVFMIDDTHKAIVKFHKLSTEEVYEIIGFEEIEKCSVEKTTAQNESFHISIAEISIIFNKKGKTKTTIPVFNEDYPNPLESEALLYQSHQLVNAINKRL